MEIETHQTRQHFSSLQLSNFGELLYLFPIFSGNEWYPVGSSAVVAHLPQGCACSGFTNSLLHTSIVTSGYFSQIFSSISLNQLAHSPLTSSINKAFSPTGLPHAGCFFPFHTISLFFVNPTNGCA